MKYFKVINTTTKQEMFIKADCMDRVLIYLIKYKTPDWFYGINIIQVNADKTRPRNGDFLAEAVRSYYTQVYHTENDKVILTAEFKLAKERLERRRR